MTQVTYTATAVTDCKTPWVHVDQTTKFTNDEGIVIKRNERRICDLSRNHVTNKFVVKMGHNVWDADDISDVSYILTHIAPMVTNMNRDDENPIENAAQYLNNNILKFYHRELA